MCLNPLYIKNKGLSNNPGLYSLQVPCGSCSECSEVKSIDYFIRAFSLYRALPNNQWSFFFSTLTFSDEYVPRSDFYKYNPSTKEYDKVYNNVMVFNHDLIHRAMKSWRQMYRRNFVREHGRKPLWYELPFYLITSEFGEDDSRTHRPHYHAIFAVPKLLDYKAFKSEIETYWTYGFTKDIRIHKYAIFNNSRSPENCLKYVVKYASKGVGYCPPYLMDKHSLIPSLGEYYQIEPRVFTSNNFGAFLENSLKDFNYLTGKITLAVAGKYISYNIPSYYLRRHFTRSVVDSFEKIKVPTVVYPFRTVSSKTLYRKSQHTEYLNDYLTLKKSKLSEQLRINFQHAVSTFSHPHNEFLNFVAKKKLDYDSLVTSLINYDVDTFVCDFFRFNWSDTPVRCYDYEALSVPQHVFTKHWDDKRLLYARKIELAKIGLLDPHSVDFDNAPDFYKELPYSVSYIKNFRSCLNYSMDSLNASNIDKFCEDFDNLFLAATAVSVFQDYVRMYRSNLSQLEHKNEVEFYSNLA